MCGFAGYIGKSKFPKESFELLSSLFANAEIRGTDATGFWATEHGENGSIFYHKEPIKSSVFVKGSLWNSMNQHDCDIMLCHARGASSGVGTPKINKNNHPFVSEDKTVGLIHNGRVPDKEYLPLKKKYEVKSNCDSEILLRIFESTKLEDDYSDFNITIPETWDNQIVHRLAGIRDIWSHVIDGAMAVAVGERLDEGNRRIWFFRNKKRPLWFVDLRDSFGQIFFTSTPEIWKWSLYECGFIRKIHKKQIKLVELPTQEIWSMRISPDSSIVDNSNLHKYDIVYDNKKSYLDIEKEKLNICKINKTKNKVNVISRLDEEDNVLEKENPYEYQDIIINDSINDNSNIWDDWHDDEEINISDVEDADDNEGLEIYDSSYEFDNIKTVQDAEMTTQNISMQIESLKQKLCQIETIFVNKIMEGSLSQAEYENISMGLQDMENEINGTIQLMK